MADEESVVYSRLHSCVHHSKLIRRLLWKDIFIRKREYCPIELEVVVHVPFLFVHFRAIFGNWASFHSSPGTVCWMTICAHKYTHNTCSILHRNTHTTHVRFAHSKTALLSNTPFNYRPLHEAPPTPHLALGPGSSVPFDLRWRWAWPSVTYCKPSTAHTFSWAKADLTPAQEKIIWRAVTQYKANYSEKLPASVWVTQELLQPNTHLDSESRAWFLLKAQTLVLITHAVIHNSAAERFSSVCLAKGELWQLVQMMSSMRFFGTVVNLINLLFFSVAW